MSSNNMATANEDKDDSSTDSDCTLEPGEDISKFFDNPEQSDVTIKFGDDEDMYEVRAHKRILIRESDWFRAAFGNPAYQEFGGSELTLHEDDPDAIFRLIAWIYGLHYDGRDFCSKAAYKAQSEDLKDGVRYSKYLGDLYVAADKYAVRSLCDHITTEKWGSCCMLYDVLYELDTHIGCYGRYPDGLDEMAKYIYRMGGKVAADLQPHVSQCVLDGGAERFWEYGGEDRRQKLRSLVKDAPEVGYELLEYYAEKLETVLWGS